MPTTRNMRENARPVQSQELTGLPKRRMNAAQAPVPMMAMQVMVRKMALSQLNLWVRGRAMGWWERAGGRSAVVDEKEVEGRRCARGGRELSMVCWCWCWWWEREESNEDKGLLRRESGRVGDWEEGRQLLPSEGAEEVWWWQSLLW